MDVVTMMMMPSGQVAAGARAPMLQLSKTGYMPLGLQQVSVSPGSLRQTQRESSNGTSMTSDIDIVAFLAPQNFVVEGEDKVAQIRVIRIGSLQGSCSVDYYTKDETAVVGKKYEHREGTITFAPGEAVQLFEVPVIDDDAFDTTLEFCCVLHNPTNCDIDFHQWCTRVMIHDEDTFPANHLKEPLDAGGAEALMDIGGTLLQAFYFFCYDHVPTIKWKSWMMVLLAQVDNLYYLLTIYLRVYMVDTVLAMHKEDTLTRLWDGDRGKTMILVSAIWVFPNFLILGVDYFEMVYLEIGFNIRYHLRVNLFRKFLSYTHESRSAVPIQDLKASIMEDIPDVVSNGYCGVFDIFAMAGKLVMVAAFMVHRHPHSAVPLLVYPLLIWISLKCTYKKRLKLSAEEGGGEGQTVAWLIHAHHAEKLIGDYRKRSFVVNKFQDMLKKQRGLVMTLKLFNFWNAQLIPWITLIVIGIYMAAFGQLVVLGKLSLGSFLATINIYKDLGDRFGKVQDNVEAMVGTIEPLTGLTEQFNLETDVPRRIEFARTRENYVLRWLKDGGNAGATPGVSVFDAIPIQFKDVTIEHSPSLSKPTGLTAPQGTVVHVTGKHTTGKGTLLNLISDKLEPTDGKVLCPPHVRILNVSTDPLFVDSLGFHGNLVFGLSETAKLLDPDPERLKRIISRLGLTKPWMLKALDDGMKSSDESEDDDEDEEKEKEEEGEDDDTWMDKLSRSEQKRFQLARAFVYDPDVLVIHKPVDELDGDLKNTILGLLREFVDKRGLELPAETLHKRRPHTVIFSGGSSSSHPISDIVWRVHEEKVTSEKGPRR